MPDNLYHQVDLIITKAGLSPDGSMQWQAVTSDTSPDKTGEATSIALFQDWIQRAGSSAMVDYLPIPRKPFLGISHYPAMGGFGEAGLTSKMFIDGNRFKARGIFAADNPIGKSLFNAVIKERELIERGGEVKEPIRISAAWWDVAHSHGSFIFERKSLTDLCPMCAKGVGNKTYLRGQLDHFAATRVPINPRTSLDLQEKSMAITKRDDAASIIDPELADELEKRNQIVGKSEALESGGLVIKGKAKPRYNFEKDDEEEDKEAGAGDEMEEDDEKQKDGKTKKVAKGPMDDAANGLQDGYLPMGGATTLNEADDYVKQGQLISQAYSNYDLYNMVFNNIMQYASEGDKMTLIKQLTADFNERIATIKAAVVDAYLVDSAVIPKSEVSMDTFDQLRDVVNGALDTIQSRDATIQAVQKAFTDMASEVETAINAKYPIPQTEAIAQAVKAALSPLMEKVGLLEAKIANQAPVVIGQPQQKSMTTIPQALYHQAQGEHAVSPVTGKPSSLTDMIRRSVGIQ